MRAACEPPEPRDAAWADKSVETRGAEPLEDEGAILVSGSRAVQCFIVLRAMLASGRIYDRGMDAYF